MQYEVEDFRKPPKKPELGDWPFFIVPGFLVVDYVVKILLFLFLLPALFGLSLTVVGLGTNYLLVDYFIYRSYKIKINNMWGE